MGLEWIQDNSVLFACIIVWDIAWRGVGMWYAAQNRSKVWFIAMLIVSSAGILPMIYLLLGKDRRGRSLT